MGPSIRDRASTLIERMSPRARQWATIGAISAVAVGVLWTVFREPIQMSQAQIARFAQLFPINARPPQGKGRRFLLETM